jgi:hypothetical protein
VLTDFEEFAVYDCRVKPAKTDPVSHSRIRCLHYTDYTDAQIDRLVYQLYGLTDEEIKIIESEVR